MAVCYSIFETKRDIGLKSRYFHTVFAFDAPVLGDPVGVLLYRLVWKN